MFGYLGVRLDFSLATPAELAELAKQISPYIPPVERDPVARLILKEFNPVARTLTIAVRPPVPSDTRTASFIFTYEVPGTSPSDIAIPLTAASAPDAELPTFTMDEGLSVKHFLTPVNALGIKGTAGPVVEVTPEDPTPLTETGTATLLVVSAV